MIFLSRKAFKLRILEYPKIGLFGSFVRGEQKESSDIDIYIAFNPEKENFDNFMDVYDLLEEAFEDYSIDIVTENGLSPFIGPQNPPRSRICRNQ